MCEVSATHVDERDTMTINETLGRLADKLNEQLLRAEDALAARYRGRSAQTPLDGQRRLVWNGDALVVVADDHEGMSDQQPLSRTSLDTRLVAAKMLPTLFELLNTADRRGDAIADELRTFLDGLERGEARSAR